TTRTTSPLEQTFNSVFIANKERQAISKPRKTADRRIVFDRTGRTVEGVVVGETRRDGDGDDRCEFDDECGAREARMRQCKTRKANDIPRRKLMNAAKHQVQILVFI